MNFDEYKSNENPDCRHTSITSFNSTETNTVKVQITANFENLFKVFLSPNVHRILNRIHKDDREYVGNAMSACMRIHSQPLLMRIIKVARKNRINKEMKECIRVNK